MYYGSDEFNNAIENTQGNALKTRLKFSDEEIIELISSMRYYGGSNDTDDLSIGNIAMAYVEVSAFTNKMLTGREFLLESGVKLSDGTYEYAPIGYFTIQTPKGDYDEISFTAYDRMIKFEKPYSSFLTYPTDSVAILDELCTICGVELATSIETPITITENLKGYTCREVLSYIAGIHGFFACIDRFGKLNLRWYSDTPIVKSLKTVWAFEKSQEQYEVEKVEVAKDSETSFTSGNGIITLHHSNPYATQEITDNLFIKLDGYAYMPAEIEMLDDIRLDPWDVISVTYYDGIAYLIPCMSIIHDFGGASTTVKAVGKTSSENEYRFTGPTIQYLNRMATDLLVANRVIATKVDAEYVQAHAITTDNLDAISANIKNAVIEEVEADFVRTENLEAIQAEITKAVIGDLEADFATIEQLNAVNADIKQLDAGVADINTLIFGSASGTVIQTEFSNSVIAQLGDAQIKSAMIESVSAGKITAGDIITNNVRVMSEDGSLIISDETMQISDGTRVRVQIGKDASNDYSINIWDANGNLMFSKGGITDSAIKEAIIRNDMVSNTANISAEKLNIESLFTVINNDTSYTLKSSKIYVDADNQTLDVSFKNMTTSITTVTRTANSANTIANNALASANTANSTINEVKSSTIYKVDVLYALSSSETTAPTSGWSTTAPTWVNGKYMWQKTVTTYGDGSTEETSATCISGAKGATGGKGDSGIGVKAVEEQYYLSTSSTAQSGGSWGTAQPAWASGKYIWTRSKITWTDGTITYTTPILAKAINGANSTANTANTTANTAKSTATTANSTANSALSQANTNATNIETLTETVSTQGTDISVIQGQITSKVWQQDITTAIFNMDIGGRNLILASDNVYTKTTTASQTNQNFNIGKFSDYYFAKRAVGAQLTLSFDWETDATSGVFIPQFNNTPWSGFAGSTVTISSTNQSGKYEKTITLAKTAVADTATYTGLVVRADKIGGTLTIKNVKCEFGIKATDWTPAPEDTESQITTLNTNYSSLNQTVNSISGTVASHTTQIQEKADAKTVTKISDNLTLMQADLDGFKTTVSNTYTTKTDFNNLTVGGRNLLLKTSIERVVTTTGGSNEAGEIYYYSDYGKTILHNGSVGEITISYDWETTATSGKISIQCGWNVWTSIGLIECSPTNQSGHKVVTIDVPATWLNCTNVGMRPLFSGVTGTTIIKNLKLEIGNKATDWTPAPEDIDSEITTVQTIAQQTADKFNWLVKSGTSSTNFTLTDRMAELTADIVSLNADVQVNGDMIVDGAITADKISAKTVTADKIDVTDLFAQDILATGSITGAELIGSSINGGSIILEDDGDIEAPYFRVRSLTNGYLYTNIVSAQMQMYDGTSTDKSMDLSPDKLIFGQYIYPNFDVSDGIELRYNAALAQVGWPLYHNLLMLHNYNGQGGILLSTPAEGMGGTSMLSINGTVFTESIINSSYDYEIIAPSVTVNSTLTANSVQTKAGADLDTINSNLFKTADFNIILSELTWNGSSSNMKWASYSITSKISATKILSVSILDYSSWRDTDYINVTIGQTPDKIRIISNTTSFLATTSNILVRVHYQAVS